MKIYIASSWKNQHGVTMLTTILREKGHTVVSWIENCSIEGQTNFNFEEWVKTPAADDCFNFDINGATQSDLLIYYGPAGKDAAAEMGAAFGAGVPILGLRAKGEDFGLMRKMAIRWYDNIDDLVTTTSLMDAKKFMERLREEVNEED